MTTMTPISSSMSRTYSSTGVARLPFTRCCWYRLFHSGASGGVHSSFRASPGSQVGIAVRQEAMAWSDTMAIEVCCGVEVAVVAYGSGGHVQDDSREEVTAGADERRQVLRDAGEGERARETAGANARTDEK